MSSSTLNLLQVLLPSVAGILLYAFLLIGFSKLKNWLANSPSVDSFFRRILRFLNNISLEDSVFTPHSPTHPESNSHRISQGGL